MSNEALSRQVEGAIKRLGLWERYLEIIGFSDFPQHVPLEKRVIWGVPFERRFAVAAKLLEDVMEYRGCWREYLAALCQGPKLEGGAPPINPLEFAWAVLRKTPESRARAALVVLEAVVYRV